ncbi:MAG TPA: AAA family ATPase, partial [Erysipelothrix sp.]
IHKNTAGGQVEDYQDRMKIGDIVLLCRSRYIVGLVEVKGNIERNRLPESLCPNGDPWLLRSFKKLEWLGLVPAKIEKADGTLLRKWWSPHANRTIRDVPGDELKYFEKVILNRYFSEYKTLESLHISYNEEKQIDMPVLTKDEAEMLEEYHSKNIIFYGPPGTGKTHTIQKIMDKYIKTTSDIHTSGYLAEILQEETWLSVLIYALLDIKHPATIRNILDNRFYLAKKGNKKENYGHVLNILVRHSIENATNVKLEDSGSFKRREPRIFDRDEQNYWLIVESEKEKIIEECDRYKEFFTGSNSDDKVKRQINNYELVTFHQSYSYEDFVEGLRAETDVDGVLNYRVVSGVFKNLCIKALANPTERFALFIDEINRGNISNIFGELISLIEVDKRTSPEVVGLEVRLPYSGEKFSVPNNIDIYGTMNTSDHSLTSIDIALRRRFEFVEMMPDYGMLQNIEVYGVNIAKLLEVINQRIEVLIGRDFIIGHSYFISLEGLDSQVREKHIGKIFEYQIIPLLQEYFYADWERIQWVLNDQNKKDSENQFIQLLGGYQEARQSLAGIFPQALIDEEGLIDRRYRINKRAFGKQEAYQQILLSN